MIGERGPGDKRHVPSYRTGCYYNREEDCCWLCFIRLIRRSSDPAVQQANLAAHPRSLVGAELEIPAINRVTEGTQIDHQPGTVTEIIDVTDEESAIVTVELETGEKVAVGVESIQ